jgi:hypothetical protein
VAREVAEAFAPAAEDEGKTLVTHLDVLLPLAGDKEPLVQMIANLIDNALGYTPAGVRIEVAGARTPEGIALSVSDNGPGVAPADPNGGSWSYFVCPKCGRRAKKLWLVDSAPRCRLCLEKLGVRNRAAYGFGRTERLRERDRRVDRLQAMLEGGPMRFKPVPPNWGNRRLDRRSCLTAALQRARIATRLAK